MGGENSDLTDMNIQVDMKTLILLQYGLCVIILETTCVSSYIIPRLID